MSGKISIGWWLWAILWGTVWAAAAIALIILVIREVVS